MKVVKKNVYYCDYCKKKSLLPLTLHEKRCTGNVARECGVCGRLAGRLLKIIEAMRPLFVWSCHATNQWPHGPESVNLVQSPTKEEFEKTVGCCPACAITILKALAAKCAPWPEWFQYRVWHERYWQERNYETGREYHD